VKEIAVMKFSRYRTLLAVGQRHRSVDEWERKG
jgi:hypothetical protein